VELDGRWHIACRSDYVIRLDVTTCLQLWNAAEHVKRLAGDPLQVAQWLQSCHDACIPVWMQINESDTSDKCMMKSTAQADRTDTWFRQLDAELQALYISGFTDTIRQAVVMPGESFRALADLLTRAGFIPGQAQELQRHRIRWPLMSEEESDQRGLIGMLDELEKQ